MKTLSTPLSVTPDSVIDSEYNEQTANYRHKKKPHKKKSDHKHAYVDAWYEDWQYSYTQQKQILRINPTGVCTICGKLGPLHDKNILPLKGSFIFHLEYPEPPVGAKIYRTPRPADTDRFVFVDKVNLNDYYYKE